MGAPYFYPDDEAKECYENFETCLKKNPQLQKPSEPGKVSVYPMWKLYFQLLGINYLVAKTVLMFLNIALRMINPALLFLLIEGLERTATTRGGGPVVVRLWHFAGTNLEAVAMPRVLD